MGVSSMFGREQTPTVMDTGDVPVSGDVEKQDVSHSEQGGDALQRHVDAATEKRLVRKLDMRLVPLVMVLYLLAYLDRSNIGYAHIRALHSQDVYVN